MSTSGTYTFTTTRDTIIRNSMLVIGKIGDAESPTINEITDCSNFLNMLMKQWQGRQDFAPGLKMWTRARGDLICSTTQGIYTLSPQGDNWAGGVAKPLSDGWPNYNLATTTATSGSASNTVTIGLNTFTGQSATSITGYTVGDFIVVQLVSGDIFSSTVASFSPTTGVITMTSNLPAIPNQPNSVGIGAMVWNYTTKQQPPLDIQTCVLRDSLQNDTPINYMTLPVYEALPTKIQPQFTSDPTSIYYEPQLTSGALRSGTLYLDVAGVQDVTKVLHIVGLRPVQDCTNPNDNVDFPQEWLRALTFGLAKDIAPMFNAPWSKEMEDNYNNSLALAKETTPETTQMYFQCRGDDPF